MKINAKIVERLITEYSHTDEAIKDNEFDTIYPGWIYTISDIHWTPVEVAIEAARLLASSPKTKVLDIGSGVGKFCLIGALTTNSSFTGVEYRKSMVNLSNRIISQFNTSNIKIIHANITDFDFSGYDSFYFFNSFYENIFDQDITIDSTVELSNKLYKQYSDCLYRKLEMLDSGKKLVTYFASDAQIPDCFSLESMDFNNSLKLWIRK